MDEVRKPIVTEYLTALFDELERLWPGAAWMEISHAIAWNRETRSLLMLFNAGDRIFPYALEPGDISDDPVATAAHLVARGKTELERPDADNLMITFKR